MSEKTEAPTARKVGEARAEGQVARSMELNAAAALLIGGWLLTGPGRQLYNDLQGMVLNTLTLLPDVASGKVWLSELFMSDSIRLVSDLSVIVLGLMATGVIVTVAQTRFLWASKRIGFDFNKLNPLTGFKRLFSGQGLVEFLKALIKLLAVGWVAYSFLRGRINDLLSLGQTDFFSAVGAWVQMASSLIMRVGGTYLLLAIADYAYQRWQFTRSMRMTKEEVKEDMKRSEGDPMIKSRIRNQQRRMVRMRMMANVPKADVVIVNPTHLAIAIQYDSTAMHAPRVLAKGAHLIAERIVALAKLNHIPVIQNIPLARAIYRTVEVDQEIPPELYVAMAEILAYVYRMKQVAGGKLQVER